MKRSDDHGTDPKKRLNELEEAIEALQDKLDALGKSLKDIKDNLEKPRSDRKNRRDECVALPYLFISWIDFTMRANSFLGSR